MNQYNTRVLLSLMLIFFALYCIGQRSLDINGSDTSFDTVAVIRSDNSFSSVNGVGLSIRTMIGTSQSLGAQIYGGYIGMQAHASNTSISVNSSQGPAVVFTSGPDLPDLTFNGKKFMASQGNDEGVIASSNAQSSGDLWLVSQDDINFLLDKDDNESGDLTFKDGDFNTLLNINESGTMRSPRLGGSGTGTLYAETDGELKRHAGPLVLDLPIARFRPDVNQPYSLPEYTINFTSGGINSWIAPVPLMNGMHVKKVEVLYRDNTNNYGAKISFRRIEIVGAPDSDFLNITEVGSIETTTSTGDIDLIDFTLNEKLDFHQYIYDVRIREVFTGSNVSGGMQVFGIRLHYDYN